MPLIETYRGVAYPWLTDQMGHLTTSKYLEMFDIAFYHLAHRLGIGYDPSSGIGLADVRQEIDYRHEVPLGALVLVRSGVVSIGRSSFRSRHIMMDADEREVHAELTATTVRFDLSKRESIPLPDDFIRRAEPLMVTGSSPPKESDGAR
jgi:acyl-CoA thioester hydrolase